MDDFGDIDAAVKGAAPKSVWDYPVTSRPGAPRGGGRKHAGTDYAAPGGTPLTFDKDDEGEVTFAGKKGGYGNAVIVRDRAGNEHLYGHLQDFNVASGQKITKGTFLGHTGNTGHVIGKNGGYHLHYEERPAGGKRPAPKAPDFSDIDRAVKSTPASAPAPAGIPTDFQPADLDTYGQKTGTEMLTPRTDSEVAQDDFASGASARDAEIEGSNAAAREWNKGVDREFPKTAAPAPSRATGGYRRAGSRTAPKPKDDFFSGVRNIGNILSTAFSPRDPFKGRLAHEPGRGRVVRKKLEYTGPVSGADEAFNPRFELGVAAPTTGQRIVAQRRADIEESGRNVEGMGVPKGYYSGTDEATQAALGHKSLRGTAGEIVGNVAEAFTGGALGAPLRKALTGGESPLPPSSSIEENLYRRAAANPARFAAFGQLEALAAILDSGESNVRQMERESGLTREQLAANLFAKAMPVTLGREGERVAQAGANVVGAGANLAPEMIQGLSLGYTKPRSRLFEGQGGLGEGNFLPGVGAEAGRQIGSLPYYMTPLPGAAGEGLGAQIANDASRFSGINAAEAGGPGETDEQRNLRIAGGGVMGAAFPLASRAIPSRLVDRAGEALLERAPGVAGAPGLARSGAAMMAAGYAPPLVTGQEFPTLAQSFGQAALGVGLGPHGERARLEAGREAKADYSRDVDAAARARLAPRPPPPPEIPVGERGRASAYQRSGDRPPFVPIRAPEAVRRRDSHYVASVRRPEFVPGEEVPPPARATEGVERTAGKTEKGGKRVYVRDEQGRLGIVHANPEGQSTFTLVTEPKDVERLSSRAGATLPPDEFQTIFDEGVPPETQSQARDEFVRGENLAEVPYARARTIQPEAGPPGETRRGGVRGQGDVAEGSQVDRLRDGEQEQAPSGQGEVAPPVAEGRNEPGDVGKGAVRPEPVVEEPFADIERAVKGEPVEHKHKFGSSQVNIEGPVAEHLKKWSGKVIPDGALAGDGREEHPHITVLYGLHKPEDVTAIQALAAKVAPFEVTLGPTSKFEPSESSDGAAVIKANADSPELHALHKAINDATDIPTREQNFDYSPHVTLAYVKPERADEFVGRTFSKGQKVKVDRFYVSDRDGNEVEIRLGGKVEQRGMIRPSDPEWQHMTAEDRDQYVEDLHNKAYTSPVTGLPNRVAYHMWDHKLVQISIDLAGLKVANDTVHPNLGDALLKHVGTRLKEQFGDDVAHVSGDEFYAQAGTEAEAEARMKAVRDTLTNDIVAADVPGSGTRYFRGADIYHATGEDIDTANGRLKGAKESAKKDATGRVATRGLVEVDASGNEVSRAAARKRGVPEGEPPVEPKVEPEAPPARAKVKVKPEKPPAKPAESKPPEGDARERVGYKRTTPEAKDHPDIVRAKAEIERLDGFINKIKADLKQLEAKRAKQVRFKTPWRESNAAIAAKEAKLAEYQNERQPHSDLLNRFSLDNDIASAKDDLTRLKRLSQVEDREVADKASDELVGLARAEAERQKVDAADIDRVAREAVVNIGAPHTDGTLEGAVKFTAKALDRSRAEAKSKKEAEAKAESDRVERAKKETEAHQRALDMKREREKEEGRREAAGTARDKRLDARFKVLAAEHGAKKTSLPIKVEGANRDKKGEKVYVDKTVSGLRVGPLFIHKSSTTTYAVTHINSGLALRHFDTVSEAQRGAAIALDSGIPWGDFKTGADYVRDVPEPDRLRVDTALREISERRVSDEDLATYDAAQSERLSKLARPDRPSEHEARQGKPSARHGLTDRQAEYVAGELEYAVLSGHFDEKGHEPYTIDVPGGGVYRVTTREGANTLHKTLTGRPVSEEVGQVDSSGKALPPSAPADATPPKPSGKVDLHDLASRYEAEDPELAAQFRAEAKRREEEGEPAPAARRAKAKKGGPEGQGSPQRAVGRGGTATATKPPRIGLAGTKPTGPVKSPVQMISDFAKSIDKKITVARLPAKTAGIYYPGSGRTNLARAGDIDTAGHELGHALDDKYGIVADWANDPTSPFDSELILKFAPHGSAPPPGHPNEVLYIRAEGVAEWTTAYIKDPVTTRREAPKFTAFYESKVPADVRAKIDAFSKDVREWGGAGPLARKEANVAWDAREKSLREKNGLGPGLKGRVQAAITDALAPAIEGEHTARLMRGLDRPLPENDFETLARLWSHVNAKIEHSIHFGPPDAATGNSAFPGGVERLLEPFDKSSAASLDRDMRHAALFQMSRREIERSRQYRDEENQKAGKSADRVTAKAQKRIDEVNAITTLVRARVNERHDAALALQRAELEGDMQERAGQKVGRVQGRTRAMLRGGNRAAKRILEGARNQITKAQVEVRAVQGQKDAAIERAVEKHRQEALDRVEKGRVRRVERIEKGRDALIDKIFAKYDAIAEARSSLISGAGGGIFHDAKEAREAINELRMNPEAFKTAKAGAKLLDEWADANLRYLRDQGLISAKQYKDIKAKNQFYISFKRIMEEDFPAAGRHAATGAPVGAARKVLQKFKGSGREIVNPYVSLMEDTARSIQEADRNKAMLALVKPLRSDRKMYEGDVADLAKIGSLAKKGDPNTIRIWNGGQEEHWQFAPDIYKSLKGWSAGDDPNIFQNVMRAPGRLLRFAVTHSPGFAVRNIQRDAWHRALVSATGSKPWDVLKPEGGGREEYKAQGGQGAEYYFSDRPSYYKFMKKTVNELRADRSSIVATMEDIARLYPRMIHSSEMRGRVAEFNRAKKHAMEKLGYDEKNARLYAAAQANDLLDFARAGWLIKSVNRYIPFTNAAVQGMSKTVRAAGADPGGFAARAAIYALLPEIAVYMLNAQAGNEKEYQEQPAYLKDTFYNVKLHDDLWLRIPKAFEVGTIASAAGRLISQARGDKHAWDGYPTSLIRSILPVDPDAAIAGPFRPVIETMTNYDFFRDRYIVPPDEKELDVERRQGTKYASTVGQALQKAFGNAIDARNVDHLIKTQLGGLGDLGLRAVDIAAGKDGRSGALRQAGMAMSGVLVPSPGWIARDTQFVLGRAEGLGEKDASAVRDFRDLLRTYQEAQDARSRDALAARVRKVAAALRAQYDKSGSFLTLEEKAKRQQSAMEQPYRRAEKDAERRAIYGGGR